MYKTKQVKEIDDKSKYFPEITGKQEKNYTATIIFYDNMCPSIRDFVLKHYATNEKGYETNNTYLIIITTESKSVISLLSDYNLSPDLHNNIIIDSNYTFVKYNESRIDFYPRVIKIRKNKVVADKLFSTPDSIGEIWQDYLIEATNEQKIIIK